MIVFDSTPRSMEPQVGITAAITISELSQDNRSQSSPFKLVDIMHPANNNIQSLLWHGVHAARDMQQ